MMLYLNQNLRRIRLQHPHNRTHHYFVAATVGFPFPIAIALVVPIFIYICPSYLPYLSHKLPTISNSEPFASSHDLPHLQKLQSLSLSLSLTEIKKHTPKKKKKVNLKPQSFFGTYLSIWNMKKWFSLSFIRASTLLLSWYLIFFL